MDGEFPRLFLTDHFERSGSALGTSRIVSPFPTLESSEFSADECLFAEEPLQLHFTEEGVPVEGQATGTYLKLRELNTLQVSYEIVGLIQLYGLGRLELNGEISVMGGARPRASGELYLTTDVGTIALALVDGGDCRLDSLPESMQFTVSRATGPYSHAGGSGTVYLSQAAMTDATGRVHLEIV